MLGILLYLITLNDSSGRGIGPSQAL